MAAVDVTKTPDEALFVTLCRRADPTYKEAVLAILREHPAAAEDPAPISYTSDGLIDLAATRERRIHQPHQRPIDSK